MSKIQEYLKNEHVRESSFQKQFSCDSFLLQKDKDFHWNMMFSVQLVNFLKNKKILNENFDVKDLQFFHNVVDKKYLEYSYVSEGFTRPAIDSLIFEFAESHEDFYQKFLMWIHKNVVKKDFFFQRIPTIRFHFPGVEEKHKPALPTWHNDHIFGHNPREFNIWFSLTNNKHSDFWILDVEKSCEWISEYNFDRRIWHNVTHSFNKSFISHGFEISKEVENIYENILLFDSRCIHTATFRSEKDPTTKISIDTRIIPVDDFEWPVIDGEPVFRGAGIKKAEFRPGGRFGYHEKSIEQILKEKA
jgi:hypothetical protein